MVRPLARMMVRFVTAATAAALAFAVVPPASALSSPAAQAAPASSTDGTVDRSGPVIQPVLRRHLDSVGSSTPVTVMVQGGGDVAAAKAAVADAGLAPGTSMDLIGIVTATGTAAQVLALGADPRVSRLDWADEPLIYYGTKNHQATRAEQVHAGAVDVDANGTLDGFTGKGASVAIVDSGTDGTHPMFADADGNSRVKKNIKVICPNGIGSIVGYDTVADCVADQTAAGNDTDTESGGGHGTHVTGIAAGSIVTDEADRQLRGGAPDSDIVAVSTGATLSVYAGTVGLYWVLDNNDDPCGDGSCAPIVAVNNSWGPPGGGTFDPESPNSVVQRALVDEGVVVVWAAGNDGGDGTENLTNPPGADPTPGVISVANYDDAGTGSRDNDLDASSSRGKRGVVSTYPDISAPGTSITSACRPTLPVCFSGGDQADPNYNTITGTSMAAPHIAGYVAVLQEAALRVNGAFLSPGTVEDLLLDSAHRFGSRTYEPDSRNPDSKTGTTFDAGHGLVDLTAAVERLTGLSAPAAPQAQCAVDARFTDAIGDANGALGVGTPLPSAPGVDVVESWLTTDPGSGDVAFHIAVDDLASSPGGPEGTGEYFDYNFAFGGAGYYLGATRSAEDGTSFVLGNFSGEGGTRKTLMSGLPGSFDADKDEIRVTLPASAWSKLGLPGTFAAGQSISGLNIVARRSLVLLVPDADKAAGGCAYTIGAGSTPPGTGSASGKHPPKIHKVKTRSLKGRPKSLREDVRIRFRAIATDVDNDRIRYRWWYGDGTRGKGAKHAHRYTKPGVYRVKLRVSDGRLTDVKRFKVVIR